MKYTLIIAASIVVAALIIVFVGPAIDATQLHRQIELEKKVADLEQKLDQKEKLIDKMENDIVRRAVADYFSDPLSQEKP
jgi:hypothetical protein